MGFFKELKKLKETADAQPKRPSLTEGMRMANETISGMQASQQLLTTGLDGQATITSVATTSAFIGHSPVVQFVLQVSVGGHAPYEVTHSQAISQIMIPQVQPGMTVAVKVDPADNSKIHILA